MLFVAPKHKSPFVSQKGQVRYVILSPEQVAKKLAVSVDIVRTNWDAPYTKEMEKYAGRVCVATVVSANNVKMKGIDGDLGEGTYRWSMDFIERIPTVAEKAKEKEKDISPRKSEKYKILLAGGTVHIENVSAEDIQPIEEKNFYKVNIKKYMAQFGASDWYTISCLCTTMFGEHDKSYVCVHSSTIVPQDSESDDDKEYELD